MRLERQCARCCDTLSLLCHALVDSPAKTRALWLLTRIADFLLKVHGGEWATYHPLRQRVFFRQLAADITGVLHGDLAASIPPELQNDCESAVRDFLAELQAARHYPGKPNLAFEADSLKTLGTLAPRQLAVGQPQFFH